MFYERFEKLCRERGYTPGGVVIQARRVLDFLGVKIPKIIEFPVFYSDCKSAGNAYGGSNPPAPTNA